MCERQHNYKVGVGPEETQFGDYQLSMPLTGKLLPLSAAHIEKKIKAILFLAEQGEV